MVKWTEYEDQYQDAVEWLAQTEATVQTFNRLQNTLSEKRDILEQFQNHLQTVFDWQKDLDRLNMRAQQLLETCADSRVSNAVTSITTKYNALLSLAKEAMRRLEVHFQEHQQHSALFQECQEWIERTKEKVVESSGGSGEADVSRADNLSELKGRLHQIKCIRQSLEQGHHKLRYVQELKERVILNTEQSGAQQIQDDTEVLRSDFDKLSRDVQEARETLSARISVLEDIDKAHQMFVDWLQEIMDKVPSPVQGAEGLTDLSDKKSALEKYKVLLHDALSHAEVLQRLQDKLAAQPDLPREEYDSSIERYEQLKATIQKTISMMEELVQQHEEYKQGYVDATDWIRRTRLDVQQFGDFNGERAAVEEKLQKCSELRQTFPTGDQLVEKAVKLSEVVINGSSAEGQEVIKQELAQLRAEWESLVSCSDETLKSLSDCCSAWSDFQDVYQRMKKWLTEFQAKWSEESSSRNAPDDASEPRLLRCRELLKEAESQKAWLEDLNDRCEILMEHSTCSRVREETVQLQAGYTAVVGNVQSLLSRLEKTKTDHTDFVIAKKEFSDWLERAQGTVQDCSGPSGNEAAAKEKYELVRSVASRLTEGQHLMNVMMDSFTKALSASQANQQESFREEIATLRANWDQLNIGLNNTVSQLKGAINRWEEFREACTRTEQWLTGIEQTLVDYPQSKGEVGEMKTLMERLKSQQMELERRKADLDHLKREAGELSTWCNDTQCVTTVDKLHNKWNELAVVATSYHSRLEEEVQEYNAYHQALQDTEKWILQTSFHLMAHNSMYITTREQTEVQTTKHNVSATVQ